MYFFDTHCHLNFQAFEKDYRKVIERSQKAGVEMLVVGTDLKTCQKAIQLAKEFEGVWAAVGFHPIHLGDRNWELEVKAIAGLAENSLVRAIGEIGYDNFRLKKENFELRFKQQTQVLDKFLGLAFRLEKPVIFHARGWVDELAEKIKQDEVKLKRVGAGVHCFPGDFKLAQWLADRGFYLGFNGMISQKLDWDQVIRKIDLKNILLETDAPFLTPVSRGKVRNEPIFVKDVAERIARLKNLALERVAEQTFQNGKNFLGINIVAINTPQTLKNYTS